jgi:hypothetical protein
MEKIKLPRSSYEEITKIITAYGTQNKPRSLDDIAQTSGVTTTSVSANNAFLSLIEIIEGGNKKSITDKGGKLAQALGHNIEEEIRQSWDEIIDENDFLTKMVQAVKIRRGMEASQLENHIAFSSGELKTSAVKTGARAVVDMLLASGKVRADGDKIVVSDETSNLPNEASPKTTMSDSKQQTITNFRIQTPSNLGGISININLTINAKPNELTGLGTKIKELIKDISGNE